MVCAVHTWTLTLQHRTGSYSTHRHHNNCLTYTSIHEMLQAGHGIEHTNTSVSVAALHKGKEKARWCTVAKGMQLGTRVLGNETRPVFKRSIAGLCTADGDGSTNLLNERRDMILLYKAVCSKSTVHQPHSNGCTNAAGSAG